MFQQLAKQAEAGSLHVQIGKTFHLDQKRSDVRLADYTDKWQRKMVSGVRVTELIRIC